MKHIKVNPAEEEDVVIVAGVVEEAPVPAGEEAPGEREAAPAVLPQDEAAAPAPVPARKKAEFHETTLDDLKGSGMGGMQKAIIAVAVLAVAAFVIWYVLLR